MAVDAARAQALFLAASDLADPAEWAAYLDHACGGDADLRARVEALLRANAAAPLPPPQPFDATVDSDRGAPIHGVTGEYTPEPEAAPTNEFRPQVEPGLIIAGRYALVQKIGEGGMGEVWVAQQTEPVKRKVALKLIKTGMDSKAVLARFEQERQALAMMDHPNIARVLDGGMTPTGQPFFVMELVNGRALNKFCDETKLTPRERLELFVPICQAVQHAHQKGIVHRDLKPANILVTLIDGKAVPKVIDFGVAKATAGKLTDESMSTQFGAVVGTLEYMSPEQAGFTGEDIDTRADIYSLGVILYEMLTGLRPIDARRLKKAALTEMIRIIREEEPSKPSTRLSTDEMLPSLAALRQTEPKKLMALLRGELDWVVMKCLEKQRERRYETANALARDIQRYLADEVVEARPPSAGYRLKKFVRRHKGQVIAGSLILIALLTGIIGTTWQAFRAELARADEAKQRAAAEDNLRAATIARENEEIERKKAQAEKVIREEQGLLALGALRGTSIFIDNYLKNKPSLAVLRLEIQKVTLRDLEKLSKHMAEHPLSGRTEAGALQRIGDVYLLANRVQEAHQEYLKAEKVLMRFMTNNENDPVGPRNLAAITNILGDVELRLGDTLAARNRYANALALRQQWLRALDADAETRKAKPIAEQSIAESHTLMGGVFLELGDPFAAVESYQAADGIYGRLPQKDQLPLRAERLEVRDQIANCLYRLGRSVAAEQGHLAVLQEREALVKAYPQASGLKTAVAFSHLRLGDFYLFSKKDAGRALKHYLPLHEDSQARTKADSDDLAAKRQLSSLQYRVAVTIGRIGDDLPSLSALVCRALARAQFVECLKLRTELAATDRKDTRGQIDLLVILGRLGRSAEAEKVAMGLLAQAPNDRRVLFQTACGLALASTDHSPTAERCRAQAFNVLNDLVNKGWKDRIALETDPDLDAIRSDKRFAEVLAALPSRAKQ